MSQVFTNLMWIVFIFNTKKFCWGTEDDSDLGEPLFLSPIIRDGEIEKAHNLSRVGQLPGTNSSSFESYSGFITVSEEYSSNLFFWFIPSQDVDPSSAPLILFLDGGPGISSMLALFAQNGPYVIRKDMTLVQREFDWTKRFSMLYVDQPVGTGFSFTDDDAGYARNQDDVGRDLYSFLLQFFTMFPDHQSNEFYIGGESYAGKYIPTVSLKIITENPDASLKINLNGLFIGGAFIDPSPVMLSYADYMFNLGLLDIKERTDVQARTDRIVQLIKTNNFTDATLMFATLFAEYVNNRTGYYSWDNVLMTMSPSDFWLFADYLDLMNTRRALNVGNRTIDLGNYQVYWNLYSDITDTAKPAFVGVLNSNQCRIMLFNGNLDIIVPSTSTVAFIDSLDTWPLLQTYRDTAKVIWRLPSEDQDVAGYATTAGNFTYVIVRGAGHYAPTDQPERLLDMVTRFIQNRTFGD